MKFRILKVSASARPSITRTHGKAAEMVNARLCWHLANRYFLPYTDRFIAALRGVLSITFAARCTVQDA